MSINRTLQSSKVRRINVRPIMTSLRLIIHLQAIKAITISDSEDSTIPILKNPRFRFLQLTRITPTPRKPILRPPFARHARLGELAVYTTMERQTALVIEEFFVIALEVVVVALAAGFAVHRDLPRCFPFVLGYGYVRFRSWLCFCGSGFCGCCNFRSLGSLGSVVFAGFGVGVGRFRVCVFVGRFLVRGSLCITSRF